MRILLFLSLLLLSSYGDTIPKRCSSSVNCKSCHGHLVKDWESSWHARSHYDKNEYYRKSVDYLAKKIYKSTNTVIVKCAKCHNPRIGVRQVADIENINHAFGIDLEDSPLSKAVEAEVLKEGINCIVCHKIDTISPSKQGTDQGNAILTWLAPGTIGGPFDDAKSNFHKTKQQNFFNNPDTLCLVCHSSMRSLNGVEIANTGDEFQSIKSKKSCADCHMSEKTEGFASIAPNPDGEKVKRQIRRHKFAGAHHRDIIKDALGLQIKVGKKSVTAVLTNPNPHAVPTGFGGREIIVEARLYRGERVMKKQKSLTSYFLSRHQHKTIPHFASTQIQEGAVPPLGSKEVTFTLMKGVDRVEIFVWYRLVNDQIRTLLDLKEKTWSELELITSMGKKI